MGLFSWLGSQIEAGTSEQITSVSTNISGMLVPWVTAALTIWIMTYAFAVTRGEAQEPINRFVWDLAKKSFILYLALAGGIFQSTVITDVETATQQLTSAINGANGGECASATKNTAGIYSALDCSFKTFLNSVRKMVEATDTLLFKDIPDSVFEKLKRLSDALISIVYIFAAVALMEIAGIIMYALVFLEVVTVRIVLTLVLALGPLFIAALAFEPTKKYFEAWTSKLVYCVVLQAVIILFIGVSFGILSSIFTDMVAQLSSATDFWQYATAAPKTAITFTITMIVLAFIFTKLPGLASELTGHQSQSSGALSAVVGAVMGGKMLKSLASKLKPSGGAIKGK